jgi:L-amino acid N-acyltransferase YncA
VEVLIRDAQPDDAGAVVAILNPIIEARIFTVFDTPFTVDSERDYISHLPARGIFHLAIRPSDHRVLGFQSMEPFAGYTRAFDHVGVLGTYVDLAARRQGVATQLFDATVRVALGKGYEKIFTFVRADNPAALRTYLRHGFQVVGTARRQAKVDGRYIDEIIIERWLTGRP